ncbi:MAG: DUF72 domain-containing protein [Planctomycetota bacterium]
MDFGRLSDVSGVDFTIPDDPAATTQVLATSLGEGKVTPRVYFGAPVWRHDGFVGKIYPEGAKPNSFLEHYSKQFPCIELGSTYYGIRPETVERWRDVVPKNFRFCPKVSRVISHDLQLRNAKEETSEFARHVAKFGDRLGSVWINLPPSFGGDRYGDLAAWLELWPRDIPLSLEVRNEAWFQPEAIDRLADLLAKHDVCLILSDVASRRDACHVRLPVPRAFVRFAGHRLHASDYTRLDEWVERIRSWCDQGLEEIFFMLHQPEEDLTVELAEHFVPKLESRLKLGLEPPTRIEKFVQKTFF